MPRSKPAKVNVARLDAIRDFNRFYMPRMGFLDRNWTKILSLTEAKILHEIYVRPATTATKIGRLVHIDHGYLSRILRKFERNAIIARKRMVRDGRQMQIMMTAKGRRIYGQWAQIARDNVMDVVQHMSEDDQHALIEAMNRIMQLIVSSDIKNPPKKSMITGG